jgi:PleD family two-component response regulator
MTADKHHIRRIEEYATVDALTGLHNRRWMQSMFDRELQRSHMGNLPLCALMLDIDFFKKVNDVYGHLSGDAVLAVIAQTTTMSLRPSDMVARYGGEEIAERVRNAIAHRNIELSDGTFYKGTVSIGISYRIAEDSIESLLARADKALYKAKTSGRNQCVLYTPE